MGDGCTRCDGNVIADGEIRQNHCTCTHEALCAEAYSAADDGALGDVAKVTDDAIVFDHAVVVEDAACTDNGIWAGDAASGEQTACANGCAWVAGGARVNGGCGADAALLPCGLQGVADAVIADGEVDGVGG